MGPKGGAKQRFLQTQARRDRSRSRTHEAASSTGPGARGGARERVLRARGLVTNDADEDLEVSYPTASPDPGVAFKNHVARLFLRNRFSGPDTVHLIQMAHRAGASGLDEVRSAATSGRHMQNARRDLIRQFLKGTNFPAVYWTDIPLWNRDEQILQLEPFPFLLPHELFAKFLGVQGPGHFQIGYNNPRLEELRQQYCRELQMDPERFIGLGIHGDGVAHQTSGSVEVFSWNFLNEASGGERFLSAVVDKQYCCQCGCSGRHTTDHIMRVLAWSFTCILNGDYPTSRDDGTAWGKFDKDRRSLKGSLGGRGGILQIRGDWSWYKQIFQFPGWSNNRICWCCKADRHGGATDYRNVSEEAGWRSRRMTESDFWNNMEAQGIRKTASSISLV